MRLFALAFVLGTFALQHMEALPEARLALAGLAPALAFALVGPERRFIRGALVVLVGASAGFGLATWRAELRMSDALPHAWEGRDIELVGIVSSLPQASERGTRFVFAVEELATPGARVPRIVSLMLYPERAKGSEGALPAAVRAAERWRFTVRLKRPRGLANPHGFDFEAWAVERGIRATGYVRTRPAGERLAEPVDGWPQTLHAWRGAIRDSMRARLGEARWAGVLVALAIGDQDAIAADDWRVFWRTGVGHLMSISGLHITMLAGLAFALAFATWVRIPGLALRLPGRKAAVVAAVGVAFGYALMTGYAVPAQRTFLMLAAVAACVLLDRHGSASRMLALAALVVTLADPWAILSTGFWLSFGAVAAIFYAMALRTGRRGRLRAALTEQLAVTIVMVPLLVALFQEVSLVSPIANAMAIPVVSLLVVPLTLVGAFLDLGPALDMAHGLMAWLMVPLQALATLPHSMLESHAPEAWTVVAAIAGCAWMLAPRGVPMRWAGAVWMLPMLTVIAPGPAPGEAWVEVLDVGHGLAVVVRTAAHALAYDAGPAWGPDSDSGRRIVVPFLRAEGVRTLDALVVSHGDDDHYGGAMSVVLARGPRWLLSSLRPSDKLHPLVERSTPCAAGLRWHWDAVAFEFLHPAAQALEEPRRKENDRGCVLRIASRAGSMLLTADVEARSEAEMVAREASALRSDVMLVPHHGSKTSSTARFLDAVAPEVGVVSSAHRNRFGHPHPAVVARYLERGIELHRTDREGAMRIVLPARAGAAWRIESRVQRSRYWSERPCRRVSAG